VFSRPQEGDKFVLMMECRSIVGLGGVPSSEILRFSDKQSDSCCLGPGEGRNYVHSWEVPSIHSIALP
jgi:hypothetical protein